MLVSEHLLLKDFEPYSMFMNVFTTSHEVGSACGTHGRGEKIVLVGKPEGKNQSEDQDVGGWRQNGS
jgi:hypothetical protein